MFGLHGEIKTEYFESNLENRVVVHFSLLWFKWVLQKQKQKLSCSNDPNK